MYISNFCFSFHDHNHLIPVMSCSSVLPVSHLCPAAAGPGAVSRRWRRQPAVHPEPPGQNPRLQRWIELHWSDGENSELLHEPYMDNTHKPGLSHSPESSQNAWSVILLLLTFSFQYKPKVEWWLIWKVFFFFLTEQCGYTEDLLHQLCQPGSEPLECSLWKGVILPSEFICEISNHLFTAAMCS